MSKSALSLFLREASLPRKFPVVTVEGAADPRYIFLEFCFSAEIALHSNVTYLRPLLDSHTVIMKQYAETMPEIK